MNLETDVDQLDRVDCITARLYASSNHILQVQPLRLTLLLRLHDPLPRRPKISHLHPHSPFPQCHQPSLTTNRLNVRPTEIILLRNKLLQVHILVQAHLARMKREDLALGMRIRILEQDLAVDTAGTDESGIEGFDLVGGHDDFDVAAVVEAVELVEELEHGALDFALAAGGAFVALCADGVDFVDEDNGWSVFSSNLQI
jgi:hypothetical protein